MIKISMAVAWFIAADLAFVCAAFSWANSPIPTVILTETRRRWGIRCGWRGLICGAMAAVTAASSDSIYEGLPFAGPSTALLWAGAMLFYLWEAVRGLRIPRVLWSAARLLLAIAGVATVVGGVHALDIPQPQGRVSDYCAALASRSRIEERLQAIEEATGHQVGVVVFRALDGEDLEEFTHRLAETWGIGNRERDDGILLAIFIEDRKMRIEVGYGAEEKIPDAVASRIIREEMAPRFRQQDYDGGVMAALDAIDGLLRGQQTASAHSPAQREAPDMPVLLILLLATAVVVTIVTMCFSQWMSTRAEIDAMERTAERAAGPTSRDIPLATAVAASIAGSRPSRSRRRQEEDEEEERRESSRRSSRSSDDDSGGTFGSFGGSDTGSSSSFGGFGGGSFGGGGASGGW